MSDLTVFCACYDGGKNPTGGKPAAVTAQTAEANGIELVPFGMGKPWRGFTDAKIRGFLEAVKACDTPYVMLCDSQDVIFLHGPQAIIDTYEAMGANVVLASARDEWPPGYRRPALASVSVHDYDGMTRFPDDGIVLGTAGRVMGALDTLMGRPHRPAYEEEALARWSDCWLAGKVDITLDVHEQIGVHTKRGGLNDPPHHMDGHELVVLPHGHSTHLIHFAGGIAKSKHMPFFYKKMFGKEMP